MLLWMWLKRRRAKRAAQKTNDVTPSQPMGRQPEAHKPE
jgi:hypothetical protein